MNLPSLPALPALWLLAESPRTVPAAWGGEATERVRERGGEAHIGEAGPWQVERNANFSHPLEKDTEGQPRAGPALGRVRPCPPRAFRPEEEGQSASK